MSSAWLGYVGTIVIVLGALGCKSDNGNSCAVEYIHTSFGAGSKKVARIEWYFELEREKELRESVRTLVARFPKGFTFSEEEIVPDTHEEVLLVTAAGQTIRYVLPDVVLNDGSRSIEAHEQRKLFEACRQELLESIGTSK